MYITFPSASTLGQVGSLGCSLRVWIRSPILQTKGTQANYFFHIQFLTFGAQQPPTGFFFPQCSSQGLNSLTVLTSPSLLVINRWPQLWRLSLNLHGLLLWATPWLDRAVGKVKLQTTTKRCKAKQGQGQWCSVGNKKAGCYLMIVGHC